MKRRLIDTLASVGKTTETWTSSDGSEVLVLPYGGRILGLFAPRSEQNFFWIHRALDSVDTARAFYQSAGWHNSGGDRTWLAPEVDFFFPKFPELGVYWEPRELDPGDYHMRREGGGLALTNRFSVRLSRYRCAVDLVIGKSLEPALNPLRHLDPALSTQLGYAGYTLRTRLAFASGEAAAVHISLWNLLQLPHGGDLLIPTLSRATVKMYMGQIEGSDLSIADHLIRYKMRAPGKHKFGIQAPTAVGRVGYLHSAGEDSSLVVRNFAIDPSGEYVDVPWSETDSPGSVIEACNIDCNLGQYSELEYHAPAIGGPGGKSSGEDVCQVWAFRGPTEAVLAAARILISPDA